jgi:hypothetical protein
VTGIDVVIASSPDRDDLVAELWQENEMLAEVASASGRMTVELFPRRDGQAWNLDLDELERALKAARLRPPG